MITVSGIWYIDNDNSKPTPTLIELECPEKPNHQELEEALKKHFITTQELIAKVLGQEYNGTPEVKWNQDGCDCVIQHNINGDHLAIGLPRQLRLLNPAQYQRRPPHYRTAETTET